MAILVLTLSTCDSLIWEKHEHEWSEWSVDTPATCSTIGKGHRYCMGYNKGQPCNAWEYRDIPVDTSLHIFADYVKDEDIIVEPTCTETGTGTSYCLNGCGTSKIIDLPFRHSFDGGGTTIREPTCTSSGSFRANCTKCGLLSTGTLHPLGHSWQKVGTNFWTQYKCSRCGIYSPSRY